MDIPKEGLKILAISGFINSRPIFKQVGTLKVAASSGMPVLYMDVTLSLQGVHKEPGSPVVMLTTSRFSQDDLDRKDGYRTPAPAFAPIPMKNKPVKDFEDDDIPF